MSSIVEYLKTQAKGIEAALKMLDSGDTEMTRKTLIALETNIARLIRKLEKIE